MNLLQMIKDINQFIIQPENIELDIGFNQKISVFLATFSYKLLGAIFFVCLGFILDEYIYNVEHSLSSSRLTFSEAFFYIVILFPILEEFIFRFPLKYERNYIFIGIEKIFHINIHQYWKKYFRIVFYLFALSFGFIHITNYQNIGIIVILLSPIIIGSQIWGGLIYGYIRIKLGFLWSILAHSLNNGIAIIFLILSHNTLLIDIENDQMELKVTHLYFVDNDAINSHYYDNNGNIISISAKEIELQTILDQIYRDNKQNAKHNSFINIILEAKKEEGIKREDLLIELKKEFDIIPVSYDNEY